MENQFTTLTKSYYDNYLEYKLTGNQSYQKAYTSADQGIQTILTNLRNDVKTQNDIITNFYNSKVTDKILDNRSEIEKTQATLVENKDKVTTAEMRYPAVINQTSPEGPVVPTSYIVATSVLFVIAGLLMAV
jgi:hypothetical protein